MGKKLLITLPGVSAPENIQLVYRSSEVYPLVFQYYIDKADASLGRARDTGFRRNQGHIENGPRIRFLQRPSQSGLPAPSTTLDRLILTYKADVAASRGTIDDLKAAIGFLRSAGKLTTDKAQEELVAQKIAAHEATIKALEEQAAAELAATEAESESVAAEQAEDTPEATEKSETPPEPGAEQH